MQLTFIPGRKNREMMGLLDPQAMETARKFHMSFPQYAVTPLVDLKHLAAVCGVKKLLVKDESSRFGLNAFKVLGGSYAIGRYLMEHTHTDMSKFSYETLVSPEFREACGDITFITATDGNHGRGVAWTARELKQHAVIYMPQGSRKARVENIRAEGAKVTVSDRNYDDTVRLAANRAKTNGWVLVQDTAWPGYEEIPGQIITGYGTIASELLEQLPERPTHIFLQAGVGSMAASIAAALANAYPERQKPVITVVEPDKAGCIFRTAKKNDGRLHGVKGRMDTIMAGLACGEPCSLAWKILSHNADYALTCEDYTSADAMRMLGAPEGDDPRIIAGESGAAGVGAVLGMLLRSENKTIADHLGINENSVVLCINTEGATDRARYRDIVWRGAYSFAQPWPEK